MDNSCAIDCRGATDVGGWTCNIQVTTGGSLPLAPKSGEGDEGLRSPVANVVPGEWRTQWPWKIPVFFGYQLDPQRLFQCRISWESHWLGKFQRCTSGRSCLCDPASFSCRPEIQDESKMYPRCMCTYMHIYTCNIM